MKTVEQYKEELKASIDAIESSITTTLALIQSDYDEALAAALRNKKAAEKELEVEHKEITALTDAYIALGGKIDNKKTSRKVEQHPLLIIADEYHSKLTVAEKIAYILNEIGDDKTKEELAEVIAEKDGTDVNKTTKAISGILSTLKSKGLVSTTPFGKKHKYTLIR